MKSLVKNIRTVIAGVSMLAVGLAYGYDLEKIHEAFGEDAQVEDAVDGVLVTLGADVSGPVFLDESWFCAETVVYVGLTIDLNGHSIIGVDGVLPENLEERVQEIRRQQEMGSGWDLEVGERGSEAIYICPSFAGMLGEHLRLSIINTAVEPACVCGGNGVDFPYGSKCAGLNIGCVHGGCGIKYGEWDEWDQPDTCDIYIDSNVIVAGGNGGVASGANGRYDFCGCYALSGDGGHALHGFCVIENDGVIRGGNGGAGGDNTYHGGLGGDGGDAVVPGDMDNRCLEVSSGEFRGGNGGDGGHGKLRGGDGGNGGWCGLATSLDPYSEAYNGDGGKGGNGFIPGHGGFLGGDGHDTWSHVMAEGGQHVPTEELSYIPWTFDGMDDDGYDVLILTNNVVGTLAIPDDLGERIMLDLNGFSILPADGDDSDVMSGSQHGAPAILLEHVDKWPEWLSDYGYNEIYIVDNTATRENPTYIVGGNGFSVDAWENGNGGPCLSYGREPLGGEASYDHYLFAVGENVICQGGDGAAAVTAVGGQGGPGCDGTIGSNFGTIQGGKGGMGTKQPDGMGTAGGDGGAGVAGGMIWGYGVMENFGTIKGGAGGPGGFGFPSGAGGVGGTGVIGSVGSNLGTIQGGDNGWSITLMGLDVNAIAVGKDSAKLTVTAAFNAGISEQIFVDCLELGYSLSVKASSELAALSDAEPTVVSIDDIDLTDTEFDTTSVTFGLTVDKPSAAAGFYGVAVK